MWAKANSGKSERGGFNQRTATVAQSGNPTKFSLGEYESPNNEVNDTYVFLPDYIQISPILTSGNRSFDISVDIDDITIDSQYVTVPMTKSDSDTYTIVDLQGDHLSWEKY